MRRLLASLALVLACGGALAAPRENRGAAAGDFDLYLLALSWSPGFCASGGAAKAPDQCAVGAGLGFVVHGLWPQSEQGYPSYCLPQGRYPQRRDVAAVRGVMPSEGLARYEWKKHGTCSGLPPSQYFAAIAKVYASLETPEAYRAPDQDVQVAPIDIERALSAANPGLRLDMITVDCGRGDDGGPVLQEVRICMTKDLRGFRTCPQEVQRDTCRARSITVPRVR
ncbi:ribonuclease T2 [Labrys wisconsinensis]|uniref:Ribonuclease T2 n=1 Tax=Labrys wisconsinensis TaxID=425677 RepID=A0ABU0JHE2_9HYPH|nr:ribonuclease T2 [Labrys wisconsinensis]MDQ0473707.1 ribonuclease T2 [Labrys wisconsinensis]